MTNALLYIAIVLIWGTTWIAIKFQVGTVPIENSIFYRFLAASIVMFLFLIVSKRLHRLSLIDHLFCLLQGACLFCFNFYFFYIASVHLESGLLSVIFSIATIFNVINNRLWYKVIPS
ncbi:MAG: EamA family transporter, partial [Cocleimonas sp.]